MNRKARILLIGTVLAISGIVIRGTGNANANIPENLSSQTNYTSISSELNYIDTIAQYGGSSWGQVISPKTYTHPDTGQQFCFYSSSRWAPCPGQGDTVIVPRDGKCRRSNGLGEAIINLCPAAQCYADRVSYGLSRAGTGLSTAGSSPPQRQESHPPCTGLP